MSQLNKFSLAQVLNAGSIKQRLEFNPLNRCLLTVLLLLSFYLLVDLFTARPAKISRIISAHKEEALAIPANLDLGQAQEPVSYYAQALQSRNLFSASVASSGQGAPSSTFLEMLTQFKLQGVISGASPQAIIEDTKTREVYFLSPGERIGEIELKQILPGKVILDYYGQEAELSL